MLQPRRLHGFKVPEEHGLYAGNLSTFHSIFLSVRWAQGDAQGPRVNTGQDVGLLLKTVPLISTTLRASPDDSGQTSNSRGWVTHTADSSYLESCYACFRSASPRRGRDGLCQPCRKARASHYRSFQCLILSPAVDFICVSLVFFKLFTSLFSFWPILLRYNSHTDFISLRCAAWCLNSHVPWNDYHMSYFIFWRMFNFNLFVWLH